jgi:hypothetical protein
VTRDIGPEDGDESSVTTVGRREWLKLAGAAAASVAAGPATTDTADAADYETITVAPNTKRKIEVNDGETFENKLIDITNDGAHVKLLTYGSDWTVRNVGVRGTNTNTDGTYGTFYLRCTDGGTATAENIYLGDGAADYVGHAAVSDWDNSGTVTIRDINVAGWSADGMYMSHAGANPDTQGGDTIVKNAYLKNNNIENCRLGTGGSYIENSVIHVEGASAVTVNESGQKNARGLWFKEQPGMEAINCDIEVHDYQAVFASDNGSGTLRDCRVDGPIDGDVTLDNTVTGSGVADTSIPDGVPTSAEEAASGSTSDGGSSDDLLEIVAASDASDVNYDFVVDGSVSKNLNNGDNSAEDGTADTITDDGDGTYTVSGVTGNGYGDSYYYDGTVTSWSCDHPESDYTLYVNGSEVTPEELTSDLFEIVAGSDASDVNYEFLVDGSVSKNLDNGDNSAEDGTADTITDNGDGTYTVSGVTGNGYGDSYYYSGSLSDWWSDHPESDYTLYVNGSEIQPEDIGGSTGTVVDDFEDGDVAEYEFDRGSSGASVVSSPTHSGSYALEYTGTSTEAISTSGLNAYPSAGDTFEYWVRGTGGADLTNFTYGVQDHANRYFVRVNVADDRFKLFKWEGNSTPGPLDKQTSGFTLSQDAWYRVKVRWGTDGSHTVTLFDSAGSQLAQISGTDSTWTSGGVGFDSYLSSGQSTYLDDVTIL